jgi:hypothetical protein
MSRRKGKPTPAKPWMPLERTVRKPKTAEQMEAIIADSAALLGVSLEEARRAVDQNMAKPDEMWHNDRYVVFVDRTPDNDLMPGMMHLSIRRQDRKAVRDWRDFQRIKNQLAGPEREAIELYPAESRVVDTANQFHLWVLPEGQCAPAGWFGQRLVHSEADPVSGAVQRPMDEA